jgi:hypothetical protein
MHGWGLMGTPVPAPARLVTSMVNYESLINSISVDETKVHAFARLHLERPAHPPSSSMECIIDPHRHGPRLRFLRSLGVCWQEMKGRTSTSWAQL